MNVLLYVLDSLRPDHLGCYGHDRDTSPAIDRLAADGVTFTNAFAQGIWTAPASASIVTSLYPSVHGAETVSESLPPDAPRIAEALSAADITTGAVSTIDQVSDFRGFDVGFDEFVPLYETASPEDPDLVASLHDHIEEWLSRRSGEDWFLFAWSLGTHTPYAFPDGVEPAFGEADPDGVNGSIPSLKAAPYEDRERVKMLYDSAIRHNDEHLGTLIETLERRGEYEETMILVTADHGEVFDEHARLEQAPAAAERLFGLPGLRSLRDRFELFEPSAFVGHSALLPYDELIRVPLVVKFPGNRHAGVVVDDLVESIDLFPAMLAEAERQDLSVPSWGDLPIQGQPLQGLLDGSGIPAREHVFSESRTLKGSNRYRSVRSRSHKYVEVSWSPPTVEDLRLQAHRSAYSLLEYALNDTELLFEVGDLGEGRDECRNRRENHSDTAAALAAELAAWTEENDAVCLERGDRVALTRETRDRLSQLGYLD